MNGVPANFTAEKYGENIIRLWRKGKNRTFAVIKKAGMLLAPERSGDIAAYRTDKLTILIRQENVTIKYFEEEILSGSVSDNKTGFLWYFDYPLSSEIYGLGEKGGRLNRVGRKYLLVNREQGIFFSNPDVDPLHVNIPFFVIKKTNKMFLGIFINNSWHARVDLTENGKAKIIFTGGFFDVFFIAGTNIREVIESYAEVTGKPSLPPIWAFGFQQSHWGYSSQKKIMKIAKKFRDLRIPCDVIYLDIDYMHKTKIFTWNIDAFPDPKKMIEDLHKMGYKVVAIVDPFIKIDKRYGLYRYALKKNYLVRDKKGKILSIKGWPGKSAIPDLLNPEVSLWWGKLYYWFHRKYGIDGFWNDMNEPSEITSVYTRDSKFRPGLFFDGKQYRPFKEVGNIFALLENKAVYEAFKKRNKRVFILSRSGFAGVQRYAALWTGDVWSSWIHLARSITMLLSMGISGLPFVGADIGGFAPKYFRVDKELFVRWIQLGTFYPVMRNHYTKWKPAQEPWVFGKKVLEIAKSFIKLRYRLIPYLYSLAFVAYKRGHPIIRPIFFDFPDDNISYWIETEFMFGPWLLIAPILKKRQKKRKVYLPKGIWFDFWEPTRTYKNRVIEYYCGIERIPIFVRDGAIIPTQKPLDYIGKQKVDTIDVNIYVDKVEESSWIIYEDDGETYDYEKGGYNLWDIQLKNSRDKAEILIKNKHRGYEGYISKINLHVFTKKKTESIIINGMDKSYKYGADNIFIEDISLKADNDIIIKFST